MPRPVDERQENSHSPYVSQLNHWPGITEQPARHAVKSVAGLREIRSVGSEQMVDGLVAQAEAVRHVAYPAVR